MKTLLLVCLLASSLLLVCAVERRESLRRDVDVDVEDQDLLESLVAELDLDHPSAEQVERYRQAHAEYVERLKQQGIELPEALKHVPENAADLKEFDVQNAAYLLSLPVTTYTPLLTYSYPYTLTTYSLATLPAYSIQYGLTLPTYGAGGAEMLYGHPRGGFGRPYGPGGRFGPGGWRRGGFGPGFRRWGPGFMNPYMNPYGPGYYNPYGPGMYEPGWGPMYSPWMFGSRRRVMLL